MKTHWSVGMEMDRDSPMAAEEQAAPRVCSEDDGVPGL